MTELPSENVADNPGRVCGAMNEERHVGVCCLVTLVAMAGQYLLPTYVSLRLSPADQLQC